MCYSQKNLVNTAEIEKSIKQKNITFIMCSAHSMATLVLPCIANTQIHVLYKINDVVLKMVTMRANKE